MRTLHSKKQQAEFLANNWQFRTLEHKWSSRGYGNSKIFADNGDLLGKRSGCGYDRFGATVGDVISNLFPAEVYKLAKATRNKKAERKSYQGSEKFYGLFYDGVKDKAWLDGGCGSECMLKVLNAIGYHLQQVAKSDRSNSGSVFYQLVPVPRHRLEWIK